MKYLIIVLAILISSIAITHADQIQKVLFSVEGGYDSKTEVQKFYDGDTGVNCYVAITSDGLGVQKTSAISCK